MSVIPTVELEDIKTVIKAFEDGVFVRNISRDGEVGWAMRLVRPMAALGRLKSAIDVLDGHYPPGFGGTNE